MAVQWTQEQKAVIDHREGNLLVSAAAGSGKTAVLVERILQMLIDQEDPVSVSDSADCDIHQCGRGSNAG